MIQIKPNGKTMYFTNPDMEGIITFDSEEANLQGILFKGRGVVVRCLEDKNSGEVCEAINCYSYLTSESTLNFKGEGNPILIFNGREIMLKELIYTNFLTKYENIIAQDVNELLSDLHKISFEDNKVNIQSLKNLLNNRNYLLTLVDDGIIDFNSKEDYDKIFYLRELSTINMPYIFLLWSKSPMSKINVGNYFYKLPNEIKYKIFEYVGINSINFKPINDDTVLQNMTNAAIDHNIIGETDILNEYEV